MHEKEVRSTDFNSILGNIVAAAIYAVLAWLARRLWRSLKKPRPVPAEKLGKKDTLRRQFFAALALLSLSLVVFCSIGSTSPAEWLGLVKVLSGLVAGLSFLVVWGAFDVAFAFYPEDQVVEEPAQTPGGDK